MKLEQPQFTRGGIILMLQSQISALSSTLLKPHRRAYLTCRFDLESFGLSAVLGIILMLQSKMPALSLQKRSQRGLSPTCKPF
ncbi:MAG: hypothetical protein ACYS6K_24175 [Planctomycetota bacterium]